MFNFSGSELVFLLLLALIILGPEKLPEAIRKFGQTYAEFKKVTTGFQSELKQALDEPVREMRQTAELFKQAATFEVLKDDQTTAAVEQTATTVDTGAAPPLANGASAAGSADAPAGSASPSTEPSSDADDDADDGAAPPRATDPAPARPVDNVIVRQPFGQAATVPGAAAAAPAAAVGSAAPAADPAPAAAGDAAAAADAADDADDGVAGGAGETNPA